MSSVRPIIVAVSGFSSNVGKTTLVCELLKNLPGWEAIKLTRGHYRSCGRDPEACCVSDLLEDKPVVRSGRDANYESAKDTGKFWDAGASNVHWVIVKDDQVQAGITEALGRVKSEGVIIEGNSFLQYLDPHFTIMCSRSEGGKIKASARDAVAKSNLLYLSTLNGNQGTARDEFRRWSNDLKVDLELDHVRWVTAADLPSVVEHIKQLKHPQITQRLY